MASLLSPSSFWSSELTIPENILISKAENHLMTSVGSQQDLKSESILCYKICTRKNTTTSHALKIEFQTEKIIEETYIFIPHRPKTPMAHLALKVVAISIVVFLIIFGFRLAYIYWFITTSCSGTPTSVVSISVYTNDQSSSSYNITFPSTSIFNASWIPTSEDYNVTEFMVNSTTYFSIIAAQGIYIDYPLSYHDLSSFVNELQNQTMYVSTGRSFGLYITFSENLAPCSCYTTYSYSLNFHNDPPYDTPYGTSIRNFSLNFDRGMTCVDP